MESKNLVEGRSKRMSKTQSKKGRRFCTNGTSSMRWFIDAGFDGSYEKPFIMLVRLNQVLEGFSNFQLSATHETS